MTKLKTLKLSLLAAAVAATAIVAAPAAGTNGPGYFGANLNKNVQPSNASSAHKCEIPGQPCTWVLNEAYGAPGREGAPFNGHIRKLKLIAGEAGKFRLQIVKKNNLGDIILKRNGPRIDYIGQAGWGNPTTYRVEKFAVNVPVKAGEHLAIKARKTSTLRCSSGGDANLQLSPALRKKGEKRTWDADDGCFMLIEAKVR